MKRSERLISVFERLSFALGFLPVLLTLTGGAVGSWFGGSELGFGTAGYLAGFFAGAAIAFGVVS